MSRVSENLVHLGIKIPPTPKPVAAYVSARLCGEFIYASGQTPTVEGELIYKGRVGQDISLEEGYQAARLAAVNCLAELESVLGDLERVAAIIKVNGYVRSADGFGDQPKVINGASELLEAIFGEAGRHTRAALGVSELPGGAAVEIELIAQIKPG